MLEINSSNHSNSLCHVVVAPYARFNEIMSTIESIKKGGLRVCLANTQILFLLKYYIFKVKFVV